MFILIAVLTIISYLLARYLNKRYSKAWTTPALLAPMMVVILIDALHVPIDMYMQDTSWLLWWLGPVTIAFAVPIYNYWDVICRNSLTLFCGVVIGVLVQVLSTMFFIHMLHLPDNIARSLLARSISTPFALAVASKIGASPDIVGLCVILTGLTGMLIGNIMVKALKTFNFDSKIAHGASFGASSHAFGTSKARGIGREEGIIASIAMILSGIVMVVSAPALAMIIFHFKI